MTTQIPMFLKRLFKSTPAAVVGRSRPAGTTARRQDEKGAKSLVSLRGDVQGGF
jgi:hypothetical protein